MLTRCRSSRKVTMIISTECVMMFLHSSLLHILGSKHNHRHQRMGAFCVFVVCMLFLVFVHPCCDGMCAMIWYAFVYGCFCAVMFCMMWWYVCWFGKYACFLSWRVCHDGMYFVMVCVNMFTYIQVRVCVRVCVFVEVCEYMYVGTYEGVHVCV